MADPTKYTPSYSYTGFQTNLPRDPLPADRLDNDLFNIATSVSQLVDATKDIRRSDGKLKNLIVTVESLSPEVRVLTGIDDIPDALVDNIGAVVAVAAVTDEVVAVAAVTVDITAVADNLAAILDVNAQTLLAQRWANENEDVVVAGGQYSAKHWALKAQSIVSGDIVASGVDYTDTYSLGETDVQGAIDALALDRDEIVRVSTQAFSDGQKAQARANLGLSYDDLKWLSKPIGEPFPIFDHLTGADVPPTDSSLYRFIKLTAGLTGSGAYNNGALTSEATSGSAPNIVANATVSLSGSPMSGQVVRLINSEGRFLRPGATSGALQDGQNLLHGHPFVYSYTNDFDGGGEGGWVIERSGIVSHAAWTGTPSNVTGRQIGGSGGDEARPRNIAATYYMRIK